MRKGDVTVAKNYLREDEINELNRIVVMFLDFAEDQARRRKQIFLRNWQTRLDDFLRLNERAILHGDARGSRLDRRREYERFAARRRSEREDEEEAGMLLTVEKEIARSRSTRSKK